MKRLVWVALPSRSPGAPSPSIAPRCSSTSALRTHGYRAAFTGAIAVNSRGQVGITYYDFTPRITNPNVLLTDTWFVATEGPGLEFGDRHLIGGPYNMLAAPVARGFFAGDYMGLAARVSAGEGGSRQNAANQASNEDGSRGFVPLFVMTNCADNSCKAQGTLDGSPAGPDSTDVFTNPISP